MLTLPCHDAGMRALFCLTLSLLAACGAPPATEKAAIGFDSNVAMEPPCAPFDPCAVQDPVRIAREAAAEERERERLIQLLATGPGDPAGDARRAAAQGDFRLYWVEGGWTALQTIGLSCRMPSHPAIGRPALTRLLAQSPDYSPHDCRPLGADGHPSCPLGGAPYSYMQTFNRTLVADPRFPDPDLCGPEDPTGRSLPSFAAPTRVLIETPRSLSEAARRGSPASVARLLRGQSAETLNRLDAIGLTPLAWAAIEERADIARLLMAAGADPLNGLAQWRSAWLPLEIALSTRGSPLAAQMLTPAVARRLQPWPCPAVAAAIRGDHVAIVRRMLSGANTCERIGEMARGARSPAMAELVGAMDPRPRIERMNLAIRNNSPAQIRQALRAGSSPNAGLDAQHSPLGNAIHSRVPAAMLEMVRILLAAGANPNGPAVSPGGRSNEPAPTPLLVLIEHATNRSQMEPESQLADLRRALDLLLAAGASTDVRDPLGRPLAVRTIIGTTGVNTPLPRGWLRRLQQAGMDINATWQGSTALDWLDARGGANSDWARELIALGGRRLRSAVVAPSEMLSVIP
jgi:hypothetical protein